MKTQVIIKEGRLNSWKELKIMQKEVDTMKVQLIELQMCKLKTSEEIRSNQKGKLSFVKKKILVQNLILVC